MNKAIEILKEISENGSVNLRNLQEIPQAIAELTAHKAKIEDKGYEMRTIVYYKIHRKDDGYRIKSKDITMGDIGIWINDGPETDCVNNRLFIPYHNINQIVEYTEEIDD